MVQNWEEVAVEEFLEGQPWKVINNNGCRIYQDKNEVHPDYPPPDAPFDLDELEALFHWSHKNSSGDYILVDIQGVGRVLTDLQVASPHGEFLAGNFGVEVMEMHTCGQFCRKANLD